MERGTSVGRTKRSIMMMLRRRERYDAMPKDITVKELVENDTSSIFVPDLRSAMPVLSQNQNVIIVVCSSSST